MKRLLLVLFVWMLAGDSLRANPVMREDGAIYLSDFDQLPALRLRLREPVRSFFQSNFQRYAGTLRYPQEVEVQAVSETAFRVRGNAQQGQILAWIPPEALEDVPPDLVKNLRAAEERRKMVEELIAKNEVAIGMSLEEVRRSLGRPQKITNKADQEGTQQVWEYIRYRQIPQQTVVNTVNGPVTSVVYVKVPVGTLEVRCEEGYVVSLEQTEGTLVGAGSSIVVPPLVVPW